MILTHPSLRTDYWHQDQAQALLLRHPPFPWSSQRNRSPRWLHSPGAGRIEPAPHGWAESQVLKLFFWHILVDDSWSFQVDLLFVQSFSVGRRDFQLLSNGGCGLKSCNVSRNGHGSCRGASPIGPAPRTTILPGNQLHWNKTYYADPSWICGSKIQ